MSTAFNPVILILAAATLAYAPGARAQNEQQYQPSGPPDAQNWQEQEKRERERQEQTQQHWDNYNQGQEQYQRDLQQQQQQQQQNAGPRSSAARQSDAAEFEAVKASGNAAARGDYATALRILRPIADHGGMMGEYNLALLYELGHGVPRSYPWPCNCTGGQRLRGSPPPCSISA